MARAIPQHLRGFTPVIDAIADDVGFMTAAVYGAHWRYCQMRDGVSRAPMHKIAARLGISTKTARRHTARLVERAYLQDLTPDRVHSPHIYRDTGKAKLVATLEGRLDSLSNLDAEVGLSDHPVGLSDQPRLDSLSTKETYIRNNKEPNDERHEHAWDLLQQSLRRSMDDSTYYSLFLAATATPDPTHNHLTIHLPDDQALTRSRRLHDTITSLARVAYNDRELTVTLATDP